MWIIWSIVNNMEIYHVKNIWSIYYFYFNDNDNMLFQICMRCCVHFDLFCENWSFNFVNFLYLAFQTFDCNFLRTWRYSRIRLARCQPGWGNWGSWCSGTSGRSRAAPAAASGTCRPTDPPRRLSSSWCHPRCTSLLNKCDRLYIPRTQGCFTFLQHPKSDADIHCDYVHRVSGTLNK